MIGMTGFGHEGRLELEAEGTQSATLGFPA